jgi:hypothetical protein
MAISLQRDLEKQYIQQEYLKPVGLPQQDELKPKKLMN